MTKSELIEKLAHAQNTRPCAEIQRLVNTLLEQMSETLSQGERIEIRGFGSFALHFLPPHRGHNPKTGAFLAIPTRCRVHFKPGKHFQSRVNGTKTHGH